VAAWQVAEFRKERNACGNCVICLDAKHLCGLQRHFCREEEARNQAAVEIARKLSLPLLATNGVCHALPDERELLDVLPAFGITRCWPLQVTC